VGFAQFRLGPFAKSRRLTRRGTHGDNRDMDREQVVATLREHEMELRAAGVTRLSLFGSTARGDQRPDSDIDLLAAFDNSRRISLLDVAGIERQIARMLGRPVELIEEGMLKPRVRKNAESEAVRAF
jgi:predicted nucleotidyltransferase